MNNVIHAKENFTVKMISLSKSENMNTDSNDFWFLFYRKYIHRCFSCQNVIQSHELIRRVRAGRIYHGDCFVCIKCKRTLQDDDVAFLMSSDNSPLNDMDYLCQTCSNSSNKLVKSSTGTASSSNVDEGIFN